MGAQSETSSAIQLEPTQRCAMRVFLGSWVTSQLATNRLSTTIYASRGVLKVGGSLERAAARSVWSGTNITPMRVGRTALCRTTSFHDDDMDV